MSKVFSATWKWWDDTQDCKSTTGLEVEPMDVWSYAAKPATP